jgi:hypothetical protein
MLNGLNAKQKTRSVIALLTEYKLSGVEEGWEIEEKL